MNRGYSREATERRRSPRRRKVRRCEVCGERLPPDRWGRCYDHANEGSHPFQDCTCIHNDLSGRSTCGAPCPIHGARTA